MNEVLAVHGIILAFLGWLGLTAYKREGCVRRIEQKIDSFINEYRANH